MHFVPIPTTREALDKTAPHWLPFVERLAKHTKEPLQGMIETVLGGRTQIGLVWDGEKALALLGWQFKRVGHQLIAEILWLTGRGVKEWRHLLPELERYLREHVGCTIIRPVPRPGWAPFLKEQGYKLTHYVMEKSL